MEQSQRTGDFVHDCITRYKDTVYRLAFARTGSRQDADDIFQDVFMKLFTSNPSFESEEHLKAWLIHVAINECKRYITKNRPFVSLDKVNNDFVDFEQEKSDMSWALMKLDTKYRDVMYLHYCEDYTVSEIAQILRKSPNTVKTLLSRGREKLKTIYGGDGV